MNWTVPLLEIREVSKSFEGFQALTAVNLSVEEGAFHALVGPNGAGKSTLFNVVSGRYRPESGHVNFAGQEITRLPTNRIIHRGIGVSFQRAIPFPSLTVLENVALAALALHGGTRNPWRPLRAHRNAVRMAAEILAWVGLEPRQQQPAWELPQGELKRVDIAMALAGRPRLLLLDEPLAALSRAERAHMVGLLPALLRKLGITLLFTEHDTEAVMRLADTITVLHRGSVLAEGTPDFIRSHPAVLEAFLGPAP
jgi:branched-chain amino acid transport system ATP-binding protein